MQKESDSNRKSRTGLKIALLGVAVAVVLPLLIIGPMGGIDSELTFQVSAKKAQMCESVWADQAKFSAEAIATCESYRTSPEYQKVFSERADRIESNLDTKN